MNSKILFLLMILLVLVLTGCAQQSDESTSRTTATPTLTSTPTPTSTVTVTPLETYLIDFGEVNVTAEVYSDGGGRNRLVAELPDGRMIVNTTSCRGGCSNLTEGRVKRTIIDEIWMFRADEKMAVELGIILECQKANGTACTRKANEFGRCIDQGGSPEECINSINGSWKSEVNVSGYPLLQLQYKQ